MLNNPINVKTIYINPKSCQIKLRIYFQQKKELHFIQIKKSLHYQLLKKVSKKYIKQRVIKIIMIPKKLKDVFKKRWKLFMKS